MEYNNNGQEQAAGGINEISEFGSCDNKLDE
jgi:hypothetical protein